jgi:hypothetical protein
MNMVFSKGGIKCFSCLRNTNVSEPCLEIQSGILCYDCSMSFVSKKMEEMHDMLTKLVNGKAREYEAKNKDLINSIGIHAGVRLQIPRRSLRGSGVSTKGRGPA